MSKEKKRENKRAWTFIDIICKDRILAGERFEVRDLVEDAYRRFPEEIQTMTEGFAQKQVATVIRQHMKKFHEVAESSPIQGILDFLPHPNMPAVFAFNDESQESGWSWCPIHVATRYEWTHVEDARKAQIKEQEAALAILTENRIFLDEHCDWDQHPEATVAEIGARLPVKVG